MQRGLTVPRELMVRMGPQEPQESRVSLVYQDRLVPQVKQGPQDLRVLLGAQVRTDNPEPQEVLDPQDNQEHPAPLAPLVLKDSQALMVSQVPVVKRGPLVHPDHQAQMVNQELADQMVSQGNLVQLELREVRERLDLQDPRVLEEIPVNRGP